MTSPAHEYREIAVGYGISVGRLAIWRSPLFLAGDAIAVLFIVDIDDDAPRSRLEIRAHQLIDARWTVLVPLGSGGGARSMPAQRREVQWQEYEPVEPAASKLRFTYYRDGELVASEEADLR